MLANWEEDQIHRGMSEIMWNLNHLPISAIAHFIVEYDPDLADKLATQISFNLFDKQQRETHNDSE